MPKFNLDDIPNLDPAEFDLYRAAVRTGEYFHQTISNGILDTGYTPGWIPVGKTTHQRVLQSSNAPTDIAIMYQWDNKPEEMIWFHLLTDGAGTTQSLGG